MTTFFQNEDGLEDQLAAFNLYGGATAMNVGPITGAPGGWLISGNRVSGPAVWHSSDGRKFVIEEDVAGLADEDGFTSLTQDATWDGSQWVVIGGGNAASTIDRDPLEWVSTDGRTWQRREVAGTPEFDDLERIVAVPGHLVALGLRGDGFGAWTRGEDGWEVESAFGKISDDAHASPFVSSLATGESGLWATTSDGASYGLWHSGDGTRWTSVPLPGTAPETGSDHILTVAAYGHRLILLADDGTKARVWTSER